MRFFPKQILDEEFIYSSVLPEADLVYEIKETLRKTRGFNFNLNLYGKFISEDTFHITSKWQFGTGRNLFFHSDTNLKGRIYKKDKYETQILLCVTPHSLFPTLFLLLPIVFITLLFCSDREQLDTKFFIIAFGLIVLTPIVLLFLSYLSKKRLRERFVNYFNLSLVRQVY